MVASACEKNNNRDFPIVSFNEYIYLNNPSSLELLNIGGAISHSGGYRGLLIYRRFNSNDQNDFGGFDRACPTHYAEDCSILEISNDRTYAECACGGERYLLFDGSPSTNAITSLVEYRCTFDGVVIHIQN
ncbi:MAG: hypothetical protein ACJAZH_000657 [Roseivirga sp.]|jgi:hypothetical protein